MDITVDAQRKIFSIQKEFSTLFPFLKIEFFSKPHRAGEISLKRYLCRSDKTLRECGSKPSAKSTLTIVSSMTVAELEKVFRDNYGLSVQVFRKSGNVWLETTVTDEWTLKKQNEVGKSLSEPPGLSYEMMPYEDRD